MRENSLSSSWRHSGGTVPPAPCRPVARVLPLPCAALRWSKRTPTRPYLLPCSSLSLSSLSLPTSSLVTAPRPSSSSSTHRRRYTPPRTNRGGPSSSPHHPLPSQLPGSCGEARCRVNHALLPVGCRRTPRSSSANFGHRRRPRPLRATSRVKGELCFSPDILPLPLSLPPARPVAVGHLRRRPRAPGLAPGLGRPKGWLPRAPARPSAQPGLAKGWPKSGPFGSTPSLEPGLAGSEAGRSWFWPFLFGN